MLCKRNPGDKSNTSANLTARFSVLLFIVKSTSDDDNKAIIGVSVVLKHCESLIYETCVQFFRFISCLIGTVSINSHHYGRGYFSVALINHKAAADEELHV